MEEELERQISSSGVLRLDSALYSKLEMEGFSRTRSRESAKDGLGEEDNNTSHKSPTDRLTSLLLCQHQLCEAVISRRHSELRDAKEMEKRKLDLEILGTWSQ
jgi:hypothetical protein